MSKAAPLFSVAPIVGQRAGAEAGILSAVEGASLTRLNAPGDLARAITDACAPHPPVLIREGIRFRVFEAPVEVEDAFGQTELRRGVTAELHVPFVGPAAYFDLWAATAPVNPPTGRVERRFVVLVMSSAKPDDRSAQKHFARDLDRVAGMLEEQRVYCDAVRPDLLSWAAAAIKARQTRLAAMSAISARLLSEGYRPFQRHQLR